MREIPIPRYIDSQPQFFFWEVDEVSIVIACMTVGIIFRMLGPFLLLSLPTVWYFRKMKMARMDGILHHVSYWIGLMKLNQRFTNGLEREIVE